MIYLATPTEFTSPLTHTLLTLPRLDEVLRQINCIVGAMISKILIKTLRNISLKGLRLAHNPILHFCARCNVKHVERVARLCETWRPERLLDVFTYLLDTFGSDLVEFIYKVIEIILGW